MADADVKIDPNTGMPELDEGEFWVVEKHANHYGDKGVRVAITRYVPVPKLRMLGLITEHVTEARTVESSDLYDSKRETIETQFGATVTTWEKNPITKERVLAAAANLVRKRNAERAEKALLDSLIGTYPPKKLEVG